MSYNFINEAATVRPSPLCYYDTKDGYCSDFSVNGDVGGWDYWDGFHTYGCWDNFIFGTLYGSYALIGRTTIFYPVPAENYYFVKITMKINPSEREGTHVLPTIARLQWTTTADSSWNTTKSYDFDITADNEWHTYILNMGELQYWQGDLNSLRLYPIYEDGRSGDEFFIKSIKITSIDTYRCDNSNCSYYTSYSHPCPGIGTKGYCKSFINSVATYTIEEGVNDEFIININGYGNETIKLDAISNATGPEIAKLLTNNISRVGIGGYSEVEINYTDDSEFIIYSGTYTSTSSVVVVDSSAARLLGFFDSAGVDLSSKTTGTLPATGAESASSFKIKSFQTLTLFDNDEDTFFSFDPSLYNVEGGRRDWLKGGFGASSVNIGKNANTAASNTVTRDYDIINNAGKTVIDFNHPFNASGRIKKIYAACTLDQGYTSVSSNPPATRYEGRVEATGCKVLILRPKRNGNLEVITSVDIPDRDYSANRLYSYVQESIDLDCDIWVNKGDLIGVYNANVYTGRSISGDQVDALYYQVDGEANGEFDPGDIYGEGIAGLLVYARSDKRQDKVVLDVDLGYRVNIEDINILGSVETTSLEYNLARCLDVNWTVDLFGGTHQTGYISIYYYATDYGDSRTYEHLNVAYGIDKLSDGVRIVPDGYAASGYTVGDESYAGSQSPNLTSTFVVTNPQYFFVNGDQEWLGIYQHKRSSYAGSPFVQGFKGDPVAFTLLFPYGLDKTIYKSVIYFKEKWNFRNFSTSVTYNLNGVDGDADDVRFHYIPEYTAVTMDNNRIELNGQGYDSVDKYLFVNPSQGEPIFEFSGERGPNGEYLGEIANYEQYLQASNLDWTYLSHEFAPIECKGFRFYCDYHYSTKITEMELYCRVDDVGSNMVGGMSVSYSHYEDLWWQASLTQNSNTSVTADIKDTPRYFTIEIEPITKMTLSEIRFNVKNDELYIGEKGCEYQVLPIENKVGVTNASQITYVKNIYNSNYDLYVDIADDEEVEDRLIFHTKLNSAESITNPEVGPDAIYHKSEDYPLVGVYKNCAINGECWGLRNLIEGKQSYYSNDNGYTWNEFGTLADGENINFSNITVSNFSLINIPVYYRDRYWKIGWLCEDHIAMNVREMVPFYNDEELTCNFYHDKELPFEDGPMVDTAPHLRNNSVTGSYYKLQGGTNIGMDLGSQKVIDQILWFHDSIADYDLTYCGIDKYTKLNLTVKDSNIIDYSYDERNIIIDGYFDIRSDSAGIKFDTGGLITVPASNDFVFQTQNFTVDFFVEFGALPVASGIDYCVLIQNWSENITTVLRGDMVFPPEPQYQGQPVENGNQPAPHANYLILVRSIYNIARVSGASYSASSIYGGWGSPTPDMSFDGASTPVTMLTGSSGWLKVTLPAPKKVIRYGIFSSYYMSSTNLRNFDLQAYVTASGSWITLHSVTNYSSSVYEYYDFDNPYPACEEYRLNVYSNWGSSTATNIGEFLLFDIDSINKTTLPSMYQLETWFQSNLGSDNSYYWQYAAYNYIEPETSYHIQFSMLYGAVYSRPCLYVNGVEPPIYPYFWSTDLRYTYTNSQNLKIGKNFDGTLYDVRISKGVERTKQYIPRERFYTMSIYTSGDNITYSKYCDIDLYKENSYSVHSSDDVFSSNYYSYLAIDLENRYDLELIRSYGNSDTQPFSIWAENSTDIYYSNDDIDDVTQVTWATRDNYITKTLWTSEYYVSVTCPSVPIISRSFTAVNCAGLTKENGFLKIDLQCRYYPANLDTNVAGKIQISSSGGVSSNTWEYILTNAELTTLVDAEYHTFYLPFTNFNTVGGELNVSHINYVRMYYYCKSGGDYLYIYWKNAYVVYGEAELNFIADDVRWLRFDLLSGDGVSRIIRKLGIYPDISTQLSPGGGHYNHEWDYLGKSITAYESSTNLALGATVSGSSYFGMMYLYYLTDGAINKSTSSVYSDDQSSLYNVWGSDDESNPWIYVDLGEVYSVYRFKIYHGRDDRDTSYMVTNYSVQTSIDNQSYTTRFSISGNSSFERIHDLTTPVQARYVKIVITGYNSKKILLKTDFEGSTLEFFEGAIIREIEVYEYYGYPKIDSEEYPVVAINLGDQFYLSSHSIVGFDAEDNSGNWLNQNYNFCYADSVLDNPSKVDFREWAGQPYYDQWAVVKMDTAENYRNGPHYLKHVRIESSEDQNPCNYPWWWQSTISTLSKDYTYDVFNSVSSLKIEYPASMSVDTVSYIEGDNFGTDTLASWRDGFNFRLRIDDVDNLDRSYGYFYLGGYDSSSGENPITYKWYLSTLSGSLTSGWNNLFLRFKQADEIDYSFDARENEDLRIISTINLAKIGMIYRGIGNSLTMHLDGFKIERNRFYDYSATDVGCYLNNNDYITAPIGEYDMSKGTIEFWFRPDYDYRATDYYGVMRNRAIFSFNNNTNDVFGFMVGYNGLELYYGNTGEILNVASLSNLGLNILDVMFHVGIVFSNDGNNIDIDGSTIRLYFNGQLVFKTTDTWDIYDNKHFTFILGGTAPLNMKAGTYIETSSIDAIISDFKIYNFCKTDFYNSMKNIDDKADRLIKPSNFIEISKNNVSFYKIRESGLPLIYENVLPGVSVPIYIRTNIPTGLTGKESRTGGLKIAWDIAV